MNQQEAVRAAAALEDPVRRRLLDFVAASAEPVTRDAAALASGVARSTVAFHLDRLADAGLLTVGYRRVNGREGPGSGRPAKTYTRAADELSVSIPERHYDLMGDLLATAIEATTTGSSGLAALRDAAGDQGRAAGAAAGSLEQVLEDTGYIPTRSRHPRGTLLTNCPFHRLAQSHTAVVCAANHAFLCGAAEATGVDPERVMIDPSPERCCVRITD